MDVTLDANAYLADPRMEGIAFKSLLDYLRMTQSTLIVPQLVLDEVVARYPDLIRAQARRAISESGSLRHLVCVVKIRKIPEIDTAKEVRALRAKLLKPTKYVKSKLLKNIRAISLEEVARRGIERIPPANAAGEELRDVITWLMVLSHAEKSRQEIAFITADKHFGQGNVLRSALVTEVEERKLKFHFYSSIDEFIKAHAPAPQEISESEAFGLIGKHHVMDLFEIEIRRFFPRYWPDASSLEVVSRDVRLIRGALYDVGAESQYGELEFLGELTVRVTIAKPLSNLSYTFGPGTFVGFAKPVSLDDAAKLPVGKFVQANEISMFDWGKINVSMGAGKTTELLSMSSLLNTPQLSIPIETVTHDLSVSGSLTISMRLVSGKVTNVGFEKIEPGEVKPVTAQESRRDS